MRNRSRPSAQSDGIFLSPPSRGRHHPLMADLGTPCSRDMPWHVCQRNTLICLASGDMPWHDPTV